MLSSIKAEIDAHHASFDNLPAADITNLINEHCVLRFDAVEATFYIDEEFITSHCGAGGEARGEYRFCQSCGMPLSA